MSGESLPPEWEFPRRPLQRSTGRWVFGAGGAAVLGAIVVLVLGSMRDGRGLSAGVWIAIALVTLAIIAVPVQSGQRSRFQERVRAYRPLGFVLPEGADRGLRVVARERGAHPPTGYARLPVWTITGDEIEGWWGDDMQPQVTIPFSGAVVTAARVALPKAAFANVARVQLPGRAQPVEIIAGHLPDEAEALWRALHP